MCLDEGVQMATEATIRGFFVDDIVYLILDFLHDRHQLSVLQFQTVQLHLVRLVLGLLLQTTRSVT